MNVTMETFAPMVNAAKRVGWTDAAIAAAKLVGERYGFDARIWLIDTLIALRDSELPEPAPSLSEGVEKAGGGR